MSLIRVAGTGDSEAIGTYVAQTPLGLRGPRNLRGGTAAGRDPFPSHGRKTHHTVGLSGRGSHGPAGGDLRLVRLARRRDHRRRGPRGRPGSARYPPAPARDTAPAEAADPDAEIEDQRWAWASAAKRQALASGRAPRPRSIETISCARLDPRSAAMASRT